MKNKITGVILIILSSILFTGCFNVDGNFLKIKHEIFSTTGYHYNKDQEFGIGGMGMSLAKMAVGFSDNDREAKEMIKHISEVQIGIYKNTSDASFNNNRMLAQRIDNRLNSGGWRYIVKSRNGRKMNLIYIKTGLDSSFKEILIINLKLDRLELVEVKGDLDKIIQYVIKDKGVRIDNALASR